MSAVVRSSGTHRLRPMGYSDLSEVIAIELRAYPFPWTEGIFRDCLRVGYSCWVLVDEGSERIEGYGVLSLAPEECHLLNLTVRPESQGQGVGRTLLRGLLDKAREHPVDSLFLEVRPSNEAAVRLYLSEGFNEVGVRKRYYPAARGREDALVMARGL